MKTLYFDLGMGAAGDMISAALLELFPEEERQEIIDKLNSLGIPNVRFIQEKSVKCGITGTHMTVMVGDTEENEHMHEHHHDHNGEHDHGHGEEHDHEHCCGHDHEHEHHHDEDHGHDHGHEHGGHHHSHVHNNMAGIAHIVNDHMDIPDELRRDVLAVYDLIAEAESHVHGVPVTDIHFHEVGTMDAIADITAASYLIRRLHPDRIIASPVNTGSGEVRCAHGIMPVPAPATAYLLNGIPSYDNGIKGELLTPTGAALLKHFADGFGPRPVMNIEAAGYGMGKKDFETANCVRVLFGDENASAESGELTDTVIQLEANIDDMSAEEIGFAFSKLLEEGALDVWTEAAVMKKNRPGTILRVLCREDAKAEMVRSIFRYTATLGIRESLMKRYILKRDICECSTPYGSVRAKLASGYGVERRKYEYDDLKKIAEESHISIADVRSKLV